MNTARRLSLLPLVTAAFVGCYESENLTTTAIVRSFEVSRSTVNPHETVTLTWNVDGATSISISAEPGGLVAGGLTEASGMIESKEIARDTVFTLTAIGSDAKAASATANTTVDIPEIAIASFTASPTHVLLGTPVTFSWATSGATSVTIKRGDETVFTAAPDQIAAGSVSSPPIDVPANEFTLVAENEYVSDTARQIITAQPSPEIVSFTATPPVFAGTSGTIELAWTTANVANLTLTADGTPVPDFMPSGIAMGTFSVSVAKTTKLELVAAAVGVEKRANLQIVQTLEQAIDPPGGTVTALVPPRDSVYVKVNILRGGQSVEAIVREMGLGCTVRSTMRLLDKSFNILATARARVPQGTGMGGGGGGGGGGGAPVEGTCATFAFPAYGPHIDLAFDTYYLEVYNDHGMPKTVELTVTIHDPICGNMALEKHNIEQCDDGNLNPGDGCDALCNIEAVGTLMGPPAEQIFTGSIDPAGEIDRYSIQLTEPGYIEAAVNLGPDGTTCITRDDTVLALYAGPMLLQENDDVTIGQPCSKISVRGGGDRLPAGYYTLMLRAFGNNVTILNYSLAVKAIAGSCGDGVIDLGETCDDKNNAGGDGCSATCSYEGPIAIEMEPNDRIDGATRVVMPRGQAQLLQGSIALGGDGDTFAFEVTGAAATIRAFTSSDPLLDLCDGIDTRLELLDERGGLIAENDDDGSGLCSALDPSATMGLSGLAPGWYHLRVTSFDTAKMIAAYFVNVTIQ